MAKRGVRNLDSALQVQESIANERAKDDRTEVPADHANDGRHVAAVMHWTKVILWKDGTDGRRYKVRSSSELASALSEYRDSRKLPDGYHFNGWRLVFSTENLASLNAEHVYIHAFSVKWYVAADDGSVSPVYDVREVAAIAAYLQATGKLPKGVQPWGFNVDYTGIDAASKGATATMEQIANVKGRLRFSLDD